VPTVSTTTISTNAPIRVTRARRRTRAGERKETVKRMITLASAKAACRSTK
jgi:hypothetical protein